MATIVLYHINTREVAIGIDLAAFIAQLKSAEKKAFPKTEALDFDVELKKRNTNLIAMVGISPKAFVPASSLLVSYLLYTHFHGTILLHKLCTVERYQREGHARHLLTILRDRTLNQGFKTIQLWVDEKRLAARSLYESMGYSEVHRVMNYYGPDRTGIKMA